MLYLCLISMFFILNMTLVGILVIDYFGLNEKGFKYASPVGMVIYVGILQVLYYPIQYLKGSSTLIHLLTIFVSVLIFGFSILKRKIVLEYFKGLFQNKVQVLTCLAIFLFFCLIYNKVELFLRTDDANFYIPYVANNVYTSHIGADTQVYYKYQGLYNFYSTMMYLYHRLSFMPGYVEMLPIGFVSWGPSIIFFWVFPFFLMNVYSYVLNVFKKKEKMGHRLVCVGILIFSLLMFWYILHPYYGNTFRRITVVFLMITLYMYYHQPSWKHACLITITLFSFISQTSTGFFLGAMLVYALIIMFCFEKRYNVMEQFALICLPLAMYMVPLMPVTIYLVVPVYILILALKCLKLNQKAERVVHIAGKIAFILLPIAFCFLPKMNLYSPNLTYSSIFREHSFDQVYGYLQFGEDYILNIFNVVCWISAFAFIVVTLKKNHKLHYYGVTTLIILLTFFNPFVCQFVSDKITDLVYFRIYDIIFNPLTHMLFVLGSVELISNLQIKKVVLSVISCLFVFCGVTTQAKILSVYLDEEIGGYYHGRDAEIEVLQTLRQQMYIDDPNRTIVVASHIHGTSLLADYPIVNVVLNRVNDIEGLYAGTDDESVFQQIFYRKYHDDPRYETDYKRACELARKRSVEYTIVERQYNYQMEDGLGYCGEVMFDQNGYRVYIMRYDWLESNLEDNLE